MHGQNIFFLSLIYEAIPNVIRLHGPLSRKGVGVVEVFYREQWVSICSYNWDINDAMVICRQLGYKYAVSAFRDRDYDSPYWSEEIALDDVNCTGNEQNLTSCSYHLLRHIYECQNWPLSAAVECSSTGKFFNVHSLYRISPINLIMHGACCLAIRPQGVAKMDAIH